MLSKVAGIVHRLLGVCFRLHDVELLDRDHFWCKPRYSQLSKKYGLYQREYMAKVMLQLRVVETNIGVVQHRYIWRITKRKHSKCFKQTWE